MASIILDYDKLRGRIIEKFGTQGAFADAMNMSNGSLSNKLASKSFFSADEIAIACELLDIPASEVSVYFFTRKVKKTQQYADESEGK